MINPDNPPQDVFIIGAGPAGLTAAYLLTKEKVSVTVIEENPLLVGGISRTEKYKNFLFDIGGHRFFSKSSDVVKLWEEILPDDLIDRPRLSRIFYGNKFYSYPLKPFEALNNLGVFISIQCVVSYFWAQLLPIKNPKTFHHWVRNQFGEKLFSIFFKSYTEKVWGMSCDEISADWAAQRIKGLSLWGAIFTSFQKSFTFLGGKKKSPIIKTLIESFKYPRKGPGMLWEKAAEKIVSQGGYIFMGESFEKCSYSNEEGLWKIITTDRLKNKKTYFAKHLISSCPLSQLVSNISPPLNTIPDASSLKYRDFITVALIGTDIQDFPDNWVYIHDPNVRVGRVQNFRSWSPEMVPSQDLMCLGLEYFCFEGDGLWSMRDDDLIRLAKQEIEKIGLMSQDRVIDGVVVRQPKAYPVYDDGYREKLFRIQAELEEKYPTLHTIGRNGMHKYNNQDHAMMTAMLTVKNILNGSKKYDVWMVNEDAEYHESGYNSAGEVLASERTVPSKR